MFAGALGTGAATEFSGFLKMFRELPNIDAILLNPSGGACARIACGADLGY